MSLNKLANDELLASQETLALLSQQYKKILSMPESKSKQEKLEKLEGWIVKVRNDISVFASFESTG
jgi:hypothetical protein